MRYPLKTFEEKVSELNQLREQAVRIINEMTRPQLRRFVNYRQSTERETSAALPKGETQ